MNIQEPERNKDPVIACKIKEYGMELRGTCDRCFAKRLQCENKA